MQQGRGETTANHIAQNVEDHDIRVIQQVMFLEQLHRLANHIAAASRASRRTAGFHAHHAIIAFKDEIFGAQFFSVELYRFQHVKHRWDQALGQREGAVMLGIAADL